MLARMYLDCARNKPRAFVLCRMNSSLKSSKNDNINSKLRLISDSATPISWYPGHIAKAEKELTDYIHKVDVVIELRDARIPLSTAHPKVLEWVDKKPLIVAVGRIDQVSPQALSDWKEYFNAHPVYPGKANTTVFFLDGKRGIGAQNLKNEALKTGIGINEKRARQGIIARPVRVAIIGFPNVGKSALINRLLGRRLAKSQNLPGVTRSLQWIRLSGQSEKPEHTLELLDSPGIIPARQHDQEAAVKLAICNDIGEASYDRVVVAAQMCDIINNLNITHNSYVDMNHIINRYKIPFNKLSGDEIVAELSDNMYHGNDISAADRLLSDFRSNLLRYGSLESVPWTAEELELRNKKEKSNTESESDTEKMESELIRDENNKVQRTAMKRPGSKTMSSADESIDLFRIGKGKYDGW